MAADTFKLCLRIYNNGTFSHNRLISYQHCQSSDCQHLRLSSSSIHIISDNGWKCSKVYKQSEVITVKKLSITKKLSRKRIYDTTTNIAHWQSMLSATETNYPLHPTITLVLTLLTPTIMVIATPSAKQSLRQSQIAFLRYMCD